MLFVLPIVNPYGISRTQQNGIPSGCAIGKIENTRKQHPIGMHRNLRNLNFKIKPDVSTPSIYISPDGLP